MEVFEEYEKRGEKFDHAACIYPTAPFVTAQKLKAGMSLLQEKQGTMLMPIVAFSFPPQRGVVKKGEFLEFCYPQYRNSRSQDLETMYHDCGQFYCYNVENTEVSEDRLTPESFHISYRNWKCRTLITRQIGNWQK